jgi:L-ascorbate metabolism protein UlaG (beta-lactamase superfamily)
MVHTPAECRLKPCYAEHTWYKQHCLWISTVTQTCICPWAGDSPPGTWAGKKKPEQKKKKPISNPRSVPVRASTSYGI